MFISVLVRRLTRGTTTSSTRGTRTRVSDFPAADPILARNLEDEREILAIDFIDLESDELPATMERIAAQESVRHDRIDDVIESTTLRGVYEIEDEFDFSTDETVARGRPPRGR
jgi:hypothetical protein